MSAMWGADADALERVGAQLERSGVNLRTRGRRLQRSVNASPWRGQSADRFRHEFSTVHLRSIEEAARFLDDAKESLIANARQQRDASSGGTASRGVSLPGSTDISSWSPGSLLVSFKRSLSMLDGVSTAAAMLAFIASPAAVVGRYTNAWRRVINSVPGFDPLMRFKRSPVLQRMNRLLTPASAPLRSVSKFLSPLGPIAGGLSLLDDGAATYRAVRGGDRLEVGFALADTASTGLKLGGPFAYLGGVGVAAWTDAGRSARQIDWSVDGLRHLTLVSGDQWGEVAAENVRAAPKRLFDIFF